MRESILAKDFDHEPVALLCSQILPLGSQKRHLAQLSRLRFLGL